MASALGGELEVDQLLNEYQGGEDFGDFVGRVKDFWTAVLARDSEQVLACTHNDWIPEFTQKYLGENIDLRKAGIIEMKVEGGDPRLVQVIQSLD